MNLAKHFTGVWLLFMLFALPICAGGAERDEVSIGFDDYARSDERAVEATNSIGMKFVRIPAGDFLMGAGKDDAFARADEKPQHRVRISRPFSMGVHEATVGQFRAVVEASGYKTAAETDGKGTSGYNSKTRGFEYDSPDYSWRHVGYPQADNHPVVNVNWHDANKFCEWLSKKEGRTYRLPTEAEWEFACRAGTTARFVRGSSLDDVKVMANLCDESLGLAWDTSTVKKYGIDPQIIKFTKWDDGHAFTAPVGGRAATNHALPCCTSRVSTVECSMWVHWLTIMAVNSSTP